MMIDERHRLWIWKAAIGAVAAVFVAAAVWVLVLIAPAPLDDMFRPVAFVPSVLAGLLVMATIALMVYARLARRRDDF